MEGGCEENFLRLSLRFIVPPAVALLNYISSGILWRIFSKLEFSRGFLYISLICRKDQRSCNGRDRGHYNFRISCSSFRVRRSSVRYSVADKAVE